MSYLDCNRIEQRCSRRKFSLFLQLNESNISTTDGGEDISREEHVAGKLTVSFQVILKSP